jgi:hypothetical protein
MSSSDIPEAIGTVPGSGSRVLGQSQ